MSQSYGQLESPFSGSANYPHSYLTLDSSFLACASVNKLRLESIAARVVARQAWTPPPTNSGETLTLLEYAGPVGPNEKIIEQDGKKYVVRTPPQEPAKPYQW